MIVPAALQPGDCVRVVAPAGPFSAPLMWRALGWLGSRYRVRFDRAIFAKAGYLAGSDSSRLQGLQQALDEPGTRAIFCARGGYGCNRFVHRIHWKNLREQPRWLVGFSDITAIHVEAQAVGVASLHGPNMTGLGRGDARLREQLVTRLEQPLRGYQVNGLKVAVAGEARGTMVGGNLALLHACATAGRWRLTEPSILFIEDIGERPYRLDRMLSTLAIGGYFDSVVGIVLGEMVACDSGPDGVGIVDVLQQVFGHRQLPIVYGYPAGHGRNNLPIVMGGQARLVAGFEGFLAHGATT